MVREESLLSIRKIMSQCLVALSGGLKEGGIDQSSWISLQEITGPHQSIISFLSEALRRRNRINVITVSVALNCFNVHPPTADLTMVIVR